MLIKLDRYFKKLKNDLNKIKRYYHNKRIEEIGHLFNKFNEEDYYEPIKTGYAFDGGYIEYKSREDKDNNLSLEEYLNIIRSYLRDIIDNHKTHGE